MVKRLCAGIEQAYNQGIIDWKKPVSCHLYPVRVRKILRNLPLLIMTNGIFVIRACSLGQELEVPVYKFVKEALVRRFGEDWYAELRDSS
jgi:hypothetical protein